MVRKFEIDKYEEGNKQNQLSHYVEITIGSILIKFSIVFYLFHTFLYGNVYKGFCNNFFWCLIWHHEHILYFQVLFENEFLSILFFGKHLANIFSHFSCWYICIIFKFSLVVWDWRCCIFNFLFQILFVSKRTQLELV